MYRMLLLFCVFFSFAPQPEIEQSGPRECGWYGSHICCSLDYVLWMSKRRCDCMVW